MTPQQRYVCLECGEVCPEEDPERVPYLCWHCGAGGAIKAYVPGSFRAVVTEDWAAQVRAHRAGERRKRRAWFWLYQGILGLCTAVVATAGGLAYAVIFFIGGQLIRAK